MSFPTYPAYKDSDVEWLGEVPKHWAIFSLKRSVDGCTNGLWGDEPDGENDLAVIRVADFDRATCRVGLDKLTYRSITQKERASRLLQSGDLLIEKSGGGEKTLVGCVVLFEHDFEAITSNFVARMRPLHGFDSGFLCYSFDSLYQGKVNFPAIKQTTGIQNLDSESYLQERFCFPTLAEQTQIARFLDHETARIDALIEEQQRLIELLKEKRQAVISHAVTKGLDPTVPMKDSDVEWLGEVPAHWAIFSLKRSVDGCTNGLWGDEPDGKNDLAVIRVADFDRATCRVGLDKLTYRSITQKERASRLLQSGDLLIEKSGGGEKTLVGCVVLFEHEFQAITSNFVARMRPLPSFDSGFLCYAFDSLYQGKVNFPAIKQTTGIQNLDSESYLQERFCFPTLAEQAQIARFLDHETARIDTLIEEANVGVRLLQERRSTLISAAVTGKIDVRGWQPPVSTQAPKFEVAEAV
ncbi:MAG: restriction endonuclease subunit S [Pseudomonadales bacterium]